MKVREIRNAVILAVLAFTVVACASTPEEKLDIPADALNTSSRYAIVWIKPCKAKFLGGGCELDDGRTTEARLANHAAAERVDLKQLYEDDVPLSASIARIDASDVVGVQYLRKLKQHLLARQLDVIALANPVYAGALQKRGSTKVVFDDIPLIGATQFPLQVRANTFEFSPLYEKLDVDYLVVMELLRFNIERHFGPTGKPASNPQAVSAIRLYVHDRASSEVVFDDFSYQVALLDDGWDKPPHYRALANTLNQTLQMAIEEAVDNLLKL